MLAIARPAFALAAGIAAMLASPVSAAEPRARLVECAAGDCLLVTGTRAEAGLPVSINGHAVAVQGQRKWRAVVPVQTLRAWSEPFARTITVAVADSASEADLPIGMLGHDENLAMLVVSMK